MPRDATRLRKRVDAVANLLDPDSRAAHDRIRIVLTDLFERCERGSTFHALRALAAAGLDAQTLEAMIELKEIWALRSEWWYRRSRNEIVEMERGPTALSWRLARRVCLARWQYPPEAMIEDEWFDEWLAAPPRAPGYHDFVTFIGEKIDGRATDDLWAGLRALDSTPEQVHDQDPPPPPPLRGGLPPDTVPRTLAELLA